MMQYISVIAMSIYSHSKWLTPSFSFFFVCVCVALVVPAAELEQLGGYSPGVHGLPHLRWGESSAAEIHSQARQVRRDGTERHKHAVVLCSLHHFALSMGDVLPFCVCSFELNWLCHYTDLPSTLNKCLSSVSVGMRLGSEQHAFISIIGA